jgi:regulator of protease activity HflC (stomatin/prohibitin superfamily)
MKKLTILLITIAFLVMLALLLLTLKERRMTQIARNLDCGPNSLFVADAKQLLMSVRVGWRISDASAFTRSFPGGSITLAQKQLKNMVQRAEMEVAGQHNLSEFVNPEASEVKNDKIEAEIESAIERKLDKNSGIKIESLVISSAKQQ